jgi:hypothetical protein
VPIVLKSGSLNLLELSGPLQACNGIAFPLQRICQGKFRAFVPLFDGLLAKIQHIFSQGHAAGHQNRDFLGFRPSSTDVVSKFQVAYSISHTFLHIKFTRLSLSPKIMIPNYTIQH